MVKNENLFQMISAKLNEYNMGFISIRLLANEVASNFDNEFNKKLNLMITKNNKLIKIMQKIFEYSSDIKIKRKLVKSAINIINELDKDFLKIYSLAGKTGVRNPYE